MTDSPKGVPGTPIASPDDTLTIALSLARQGWYVFPVNLIPTTRPDGSTFTDKRPLIRWLEGATTDPELIATWWGADFPGAWIGVQCEKSRLVVVDPDTDKGQRFPKGHEREGELKGDGKANLKAAGIKLPKTFHYPTRSGGSHYVYRAPKKRRLTIAQDVPVPSVDVRAGHGLMVYYGPELTGKPSLAPAPSWALLDAKHDRSAIGPGTPSATVQQWLDRVPDGRQDPHVVAARKEVTATGMGHDQMLAAVDRLVRLGSEGAKGAGHALLEARETYLADFPEHARHWDTAVQGSVAHYGLPLHLIRIPKADRVAIRERKKKRADKTDTDPVRLGVRLLDDGPLAEECAERFEGVWAWGHDRGLMHWRDGRWLVPPAELAGRLLKEDVRTYLRGIEVEEHTRAVQRDDGPRIKLAQTLLSGSKARAVTDLLQGILAKRQLATDADPWLLNTPTGVVDLRTKTLQSHDWRLGMTKMTAVGYDPHADTTVWDQALTALPPEVASWMQYRLGQAAVGLPPEDDVMLILQGGGENGKTTIAHAPRVSLGDYAVKMSDRVLMANPGDHPTEMMELMGARYALAEELPEGRSLNVQRVKEIIGTPEITARRMRQDPVTFTSSHTPVITTNPIPVVPETDHGSWRRLLLVKFDYRFVKRPQDRVSERDRLGDPNVRRLLAKPDAGVLAWLVDGAAAWWAADQVMPEPPAKVLRDTELWREDADPVMGYFTERLEMDPASAITCDDLGRDFNDWLRRHEHRPWGAQTVNSRFGGHVTFASVERQRAKFDGTLRPSRPPMSMGPVPANTWSWVGVRFATEAGSGIGPSDEGLQRSRFDEIVMGLTGPSDD
jgi:putative DNA primase/helicase